MDGWTIGADIAAMLTGLSAVTAAIVWTRTQWGQWQAQRAAIQLRNWHGYVDVGGINTWSVQLAENPETPQARVVLTVVKPDGSPDDLMAHNLRQTVLRDGTVSRSPTPEELDFLIHLRKDQGYGQRNLVVR